MSRLEKRIVLENSERALLPHEKHGKKIDPEQRIEITVMLRPKTSNQAAAQHAENLMTTGAQLPEKRKYLTREQLADERGASPADIDLVEQFAHEHNLTVTQTSVPQRIVKLTGKLGDLIKAFKANVKEYRSGKTTYRGRSGTLSVPKELADIIVGVYGFDTRPAARPHYRSTAYGTKGKSTKKRDKPKKQASASAAASTIAGKKPFTAPQVAQLYDFPSGLDGTGQCIALIELNTPDDQGNIGTGFTISDLATYFQKLGIPMPTVTAVGVSGGSNLPNINPKADGEVMLDIEVAGAIAPGAEIAVYFAPNTGKGFIDCVSAAVHDTVRKPSVVSISWGGPEDLPFTSKQLRDGMNQVFQDAAALGVTVCCASGDNGSADLPLQDSQGNLLRDGKPHVDFPSSSPFVLACGGTTLIGSGSTITTEEVWNEGDPQGPSDPSGSGGGGVSNFFGLPTYQSTANVPKSPNNKAGRGVPDVAGNGDSATGYLCKVAGITKLVPIGGTSAVAPLWAGLIALINQRLNKLGKPVAGFINPILYNSSAAFSDVSVGNNDIDGSLNKYFAGSGWDACTGLGSPKGKSILKALGG